MEVARTFGKRSAAWPRLSAGEMVHRFAKIRQHAVLPLLAEILSFTVVYGVLAYPFMLVGHDRDQLKRYGRHVANRIAGQKLFRFTEAEPHSASPKDFSRVTI